MFGKELLCTVKMLWLYKKVATKALDKWTATSVPNRVADVVTDDCSQSGTDDDVGDLQAGIDGRIERSQQEHRFSREGNSHALNHHKEDNRWIPKGSQRFLERL